MNAESGSLHDTIVVGGGEPYESSEDEDVDFYDETEDGQGGEEMAQDRPTEPAAAPEDVDADGDSLDDLSILEHESAAEEKVSNSPEPSSHDPVADTADPLPAETPPGPVLSSSESIASSNSPSPSASSSQSHSPQSATAAAPAEADAHSQEQSASGQSFDKAAHTPPQPASPSEHQLQDEPTTALPPTGPGPDHWPASEHASIEDDIQDLLNGIQAQSSSSSINPSAPAPGTAVSQPAQSSEPSGELSAHNVTRNEDSMETEEPQVPSSISSPSLLLPTGSLPQNAIHEAQHEASVSSGAAGAAGPSSFATQPSQVPNLGPFAPQGATVDGNPSTNPTSIPTMREPPTGPRGQKAARQGPSGRQSFDGFLADEKRYTTEARWERFPEGSRIFVGNLVQERVTKKDVFNLFHKYGRIAQISLKSAFGFVQYHNAADASEAIRHLQGTMVAGRKINLEITKTQKKGKETRERSPDRSGKRGGLAGTGGRKSESFDAGRGSDGYRPSYEPHAARGDRYGDEGGRGRYGDNRRGARSRSRSPRPYSRSDDHRQRSPHRSSHGDRYDTHGSPRDDNRHGNSTRSHQEPVDAQILMLENVHPDFSRYVQKAFSDRGLKADAIFVDPRFLDSLIQRQIVDGVLAVVKLDVQAQNLGKVTIQVFNRVPGSQQVSYDEYRHVDLNVAVELVVQKKRGASQQQQQQPPPQMPSTYPPPQAPVGYPQAYPYQIPPQQPPVPAPAVQTANLAGALSQLDPSLLQKVLMAMQAQQPGAVPAAAPVPAPAQPVGHAPGVAPPVDIQSILNNLRSSAPGAAAASGPPAPMPYGAVATTPGAPYGGHAAAGAARSPPPPVHPGAAPSTNPQVSSILAELARLRR